MLEALLFLRPEDGDPDPGGGWEYEGTITIGDASAMGVPGRGYAGGTAVTYFGNANPLFDGTIALMDFGGDQGIMASQGLMTSTPIAPWIELDGVEYEVGSNSEVLGITPQDFPPLGATVSFKFGTGPGGGDPGDPDPGDPDPGDPDPGDPDPGDPDPGDPDPGDPDPGDPDPGDDPGPPPGPWVYEGTMTPAGGGLGPGVTYIDDGGSLTTRGTITPLPVPAYIRFIANSVEILGQEVWNASFDLQDGTPPVPPGTIVEIGGVRRAVSSSGNVEDIPPIEPGVPISIKWWY